MESHKQYNKTIDKLPDAVYLCDEGGYISQYNKAAAELWGREPEPGKELYCGSLKVINKDGSNVATDNHPMALALKQNRSVQRAEMIIQRPDGSQRHIMLFTTPVYNMHGTLSGAVNRMVDMTNKNKFGAYSIY